MTPLELSYPLTGLVLALGSGVYVWQSRRSLDKKLAPSQNFEQGPGVVGQSEPPAIATDVVNDQSSQGEIIHVRGKLRRLEKDLETTQASLQSALAERDELSKNYQAQEKMVAALQHQLTHYDDVQSEKLVGLQKLNQELLQENTNLSDRLKQAVSEVAETRPKLLRMQTLETRNQQLTDQLNHVEQNQEKAIATRLEAQEKALHQGEQKLKNQINQWEQRVQSLTTERDQARQSLQNLTDQSQLAQGQLQTLQASLEQLTRAEQQWQGERTQLDGKIHQLEDSQKALALANAELKLKLETTQTEGDRLKAEKKEQTTALQSAQAEIAKLQQQLADQEQVKAPTKTEKQPPPEAVKPVEPAPVKVETVVIPPEPKSTVTAEVKKQEKTPAVETKPAKAEITVKPEPTEKLPESPKKIGKPQAESTKKVAEPPAPVEKKVAKIETVIPAAETPGPLPEETIESELVKTGTITGDHPLAEKKIVILGTLNAMNREEAKTRLQDIGAECTSAPSGKTDYIVVGKAPGAKLKKAQKLGIPQLSEAQFLELLGN